MMSLDNCAKIVGALNLPLETRLHRLLTDRVEQYRSSGLLDMTHLLVIEPGDSEEGIAQEIGFSPLVNPMDGVRYGDPGFCAYWDGPLWRHDGWFEMIVTVGNDGFAFILLIADAEGIIPNLRTMCREFSA